MLFRSKENVDIFKDLGVEYKNADGTLRSNEETFYDIIDALGGMTDETKRDAYAMKLMGKSAQDLNPLIKAGSAALKKYGNEAQKTGVIIDRGQIAVLGRLQDQLDRTSAIMDAQGKKMAASLAPVTSAVLSAWDAVVKFTSQEEGFKRVAMLFGTAEEEAVKQIDTYNRLLEAYNVTGLSVDGVGGCPC